MKRAMALLALNLYLGSTALAFSIRSGVTDLCHETITGEGWFQARCPDKRCLELSEPWTRFMPASLPGNPVRELMASANRGEADWRIQLANYSLVVGVRFNDLHGHGASEILQLREIHGSASGQNEHCLRSKEQDGPDGDRAALNSCRDYIQSELALAEEHFRASSDARLESVPVFIEYYGQVKVEVSGGFFHLGRALHAVQDSFSHSLRSEDLSVILSVANYIECTANDFEELRDGPCHSRATDTCRGEAAPLREAAIAGSKALLEGFARQLDSGDTAGSQAALDQILAYRPGCTLDNQYCNTPWRSFALKSSPNADPLRFASRGGCGGATETEPLLTALLPVLLWGLPLAGRLRRGQSRSPPQ